MAEVLYTVTINHTAKTINFKNNATDFSEIEGAVTTLDIYFRGEDKDSYLYKKHITDSAIINYFLSATGLTYTFLSFFGVDTPPDNFYLIEIVVNEGLATQMLSTKNAVGFIANVAEVVFRNTVGVHVPVTELYTAITLGMNNIALELLNNLSTLAAYTYDREVKWRKLYSVIDTSVNDIEY
jgi:hypothetical protein